MTTEFEKRILESTGRAVTEKDKMVTAAIDVLTGLGYGGLSSLAASKIRGYPDKTIHEIRMHLLEVLS